MGYLGWVALHSSPDPVTDLDLLFRCWLLEGKRKEKPLCLSHTSLFLTSGNSSNCCTSDQSIAYEFQTQNSSSALKKGRRALQMYFRGWSVQCYFLSIEGARGLGSMEGVFSPGSTCLSYQIAANAGQTSAHPKASRGRCPQHAGVQPCSEF